MFVRFLLIDIYYFMLTSAAKDIVIVSVSLSLILRSKTWTSAVFNTCNPAFFSLMQTSCTRIFIYVSFTSLVCLLDAVKLARNQNVPTSVYQAADNKGNFDFLYKLFQQFDRLCQFKIHFAAFSKNKN